MVHTMDNNSNSRQDIRTMNNRTILTLWQITIPGLPTFYLDKQVQGIITKKTAIKVASRVTSTPEDSISAMAINYVVDTEPIHDEKHIHHWVPKGGTLQCACGEPYRAEW